MATAPRTPAPRWARAAVLATGVAVALVMLWLGLWQMQVFTDRGDRVASERAAAAPVDLVERIPEGGAVGDVYGRNVHVSGTYVPERQVEVVAADGTRRVLTGLRLADGRVLPVVRGGYPRDVGPADLPPLPEGVQPLTGVFLPSEAPGDATVSRDELSSVRLQALAQRWPEPLAPGFITLGEGQPGGEGLSPAAVALPSETGAVRNLGYAIQWWVFAGFALVMAWAIARSMRPRGLDPVAETD